MSIGAMQAFDGTPVVDIKPVLRREGRPDLYRTASYIRPDITRYGPAMISSPNSPHTRRC
jgi:hypothetical protein